MKKTFLTLIVFVILAVVAFLLLSTSGFLGEDIGKKGQELSGSLGNLVNQGKDALTDFTGIGEEKKPEVPQEDPKITKFFEQLKTATPEVLSDMVLKGFKPTKPNLAGEPPIVYMARYNNNAEVYELMLNIGASVAQTNRKGENALKVAIERGAPLEVVRILYANQEALDEQARQEKIMQGPGSKVVGSYYPSIENNVNNNSGRSIYYKGYRRNRNLQGL
ncbi:MAG: hypothetical protein II972_02690 [Elusimicrobiaceae bacterium]|nr:hypothetical protein [Elusimicrobiaceae bacterium]MBQ6224090.1 hypothetical protein [Campylobacter sp.]